MTHSGVPTLSMEARSAILWVTYEIQSTSSTVASSAEIRSFDVYFDSDCLKSSLSRLISRELT